MQTRKFTSFSEADLFARQVSARLHTDRPAADVQVAWLSDYDSATRIGLRIAALDRELRRSAGAGPLTAPPPLLPGLDKGGLAFREGAPG
ncbi:MAG: hypothetical protein M3P32_00625, partial [Chloroflexota bacterium]|nr:hypothetical protein [Chloroflexota bacterium]